MIWFRATAVSKCCTASRCRWTEGEIVSVLGANGAGKTTPAAGHLRSAGHLVGIGGARRRELGQPGHRAPGHAGPRPPARRPGAFSRTCQSKRTWSWAWGCARTARAAIRRDRDRLLDLLPALAEKIGEQASSLSGGQQQMLALARAMITRPKLLMIDELSFRLGPQPGGPVVRVGGGPAGRGWHHLPAGGAETPGCWRFPTAPTCCAPATTTSAGRRPNCGPPTDLVRSYLGH